MAESSYEVYQFSTTPTGMTAVVGRSISVTIAGETREQQVHTLALEDGTLISSSAPLPVSGPLTDTELRATAVPVSGPLTDAELRATAVPVSGPLTDTQLRAAAVPVSATHLTNQTGTWGYHSGTSGTLTMTGSKRVLQITAISQEASASITIDGGDSITLPYGSTDKVSSAITIEPKGNLVDPEIIFTDTDAYFVEYVVV